VLSKLSQKGQSTDDFARSSEGDRNFAIPIESRLINPILALHLGVHRDTNATDALFDKHKPIHVMYLAALGDSYGIREDQRI